MPIEITQLSHTYLPGSQLAYPALSDISLTIHDGEFLGIIGHTGSGKSTLIQHLNGLLLPTAAACWSTARHTRKKAPQADTLAGRHGVSISRIPVV